MTTVRYCENSTISEAWFLLLGKAAPANRVEVSAIAHTAMRTIAGLKAASPMLVMVEASLDRDMPPYWEHQLTWADESRIARLGHQYLSVHFVRRPSGEKYETYEHSLAPGVKQWLAILGSVLSRGRESYPIDRILFGYTNTFDFSAGDFDLSRQFKVNIGLDVDSAKDGLRSLEATFGMSVGGENDVSLSLKVDASGAADDLGEKGTVRVVTKTVAEELAPSLSALDAEAIQERALIAKNRAKAVFFDFATSQTHTLMGAKS